MADLSPRLQEIATLIAQGYSNPAIATKLGLSVKTVNSSRYVLMKTLGVHTTAAIVHHAIREGWVRVGELHEGA